MDSMISRNAVVQVKRQLTPKASIVTKEVFKKIIQSGFNTNYKHITLFDN